MGLHRQHDIGNQYLKFRISIVTGSNGFRMGYTSGNDGKISFYNASPIIQPNGLITHGDMRSALIDLGLIHSTVGFPSTIVVNPFTETAGSQTYTVLKNDNVILCVHTGDATITLPASSTWQNRYLIFKRYIGEDTFGGTGTITLAPASGDTVEGGNSISIDSNVTRYLCVGTQWLLM